MLATPLVFIQTSATMTAVSSSGATTCANLFALSSSVAALLAVAGVFEIYTNFLIGRDSHYTGDSKSKNLC